MISLDCALIEIFKEIGPDFQIGGVVGGKSMAPTLKEGEVLRLEPVQANSCRIGDIVVYRKLGRYVVHRVVGKRNREGKVIFLMKGDANLNCDEPVNEEQIVARTTSVEDGPSFFRAQLSLLEAKLYPHLRKVRRYLPAQVPFSKLLSILRPIYLMLWLRW